ncbi:acyl-CoA dehydrogenase N-terminal domain-containing protein [Marinobacter sp.]|uniref:acyl-CoA dehydrogenase N-terminal domain-containing protein n=1 Tax=Marinobacter sp. TaxID=50741 RepID=UPI003976569B
MQYQAPANDLRLLLFDVLGADKLHELEKYADATQNLMSAVIDEAGKAVSTIRKPGAWQHPMGSKRPAASLLKAAGLPSTRPWSSAARACPTLKFVVDEMVCSTNLSLGMYPGLTHGAISALYAHGSGEHKQTYLDKLISGEWTGTMCLTEPQCGTDLGLMKINNGHVD